ncbi:hypothetical protein [Sphingobacterium sp.]|uniref:hypothetical protein n=1 Tax=Sphingobacterium sp. TaxID=341027 RepID=UPI0028AB3FA1|nr:hypothetical protein [Sphingobacterium sp.]
MKRQPSVFQEKKIDIEEFVFTHANWMLHNHSRNKAVWFINSLLENYPKERKAVLIRLSLIE